MRITTVTTDGRAVSTGPLMYRMVAQYHRDMIPYSHMPLEQIYRIICDIPFRPDPLTEEVLMRPRYTMNSTGCGGDCDDKSIALASWAKLNNIPFRFIAVRAKNRETLHHVYPELYIIGRWTIADATYSINTLGHQREKYAEYVILPDR